MTSGVSVTRTCNSHVYFHQSTLYFEQCRQPVFFSVLLQWFPSEVGDHLGNATWYSVIVVIVNKASGLSLGLFHFGNVFVWWRVPGMRGVLKSWSNKRCTVCFLYIFGTLVEISPPESQGLWCFGCRGANLWSSVGKELSPWLFACAIFILVPSWL